eukprot:TRINITY_DN31703_c0_g1_i1.p1 TRINITY_DN31703_c0_g1~~TRINITY_DN31703_c0_g1_i1.p1  ORF type:complete len:599 (+),score=26.85 TRINITY_DN31703_c0_g1_i1:1-1797(+)
MRSVPWFHLICCTNVLVTLCSDHIPVKPLPAPQVRSFDGAFEGCPCRQIDVTALKVNSKQFDQVPDDYGSFCFAWDDQGLGFSECNVDEPEMFCLLPWCFVEATSCNRSYSASVAGIPDLVYSYQTCGSPDLIYHRASSRTKNSSSYRAGLFANNGISSSQPSFVQPLYLSYITYARRLLHSMGIDPKQVKHRELSNTSAVLAQGSEYTACVNDLALRNIELCLGPFWLTAHRLSLGSAALPVGLDSLYVWTKRSEKQESIWVLLQKPFSAFSWDLWGLLLGTVLFTAVTHALLENGVLNTVRNPSSLFDNTYKSFLGWTGAGIDSTLYIRPSSRILAMGFSFFVMISAASFTANTATFLVRNVSKNDGVQSLEDAFGRGLSICYPQPVSQALEIQYPLLRNVGRVIPGSTAKTVQAALGGSCDVFIGGSWLVATQNVCGWQRVGQPVHHEDMGFFVSSDLALEASYHNAELMRLGERVMILKEAEVPYPCPNDASNDSSEGATQLTSSHMLGCCIFMLISASIAVVLNICIEAEKQVHGVENIRRQVSNHVHLFDHSNPDMHIASNHPESTTEPKFDHQRDRDQLQETKLTCRLSSL